MLDAYWNFEYKFVPTSMTVMFNDSILQFCSIFSLFPQNYSKTLALFKCFLSILSKH